MSEGKTITVSGVTFGASEVKSAVIEKDGREIKIGAKKCEKPIGFHKKEEA